MSGRSNSIDVRPMAGAIGAEIGGIDLRELDKPTVAAIRRAWLDHCVVFFRDQALTPAQLVAFARTLGEPSEYPFLKGLDGFPGITPVTKLEHEKVNFGGIWHSDTAYETLSAGMRRLLDGLAAVNSLRKADASNTREDRLRDTARAEARPHYEAEHPVVRTHPETGRKALYVNRGHTVRFVGWSEAESAPLLDFLRTRCGRR